MAVRQSMSNIVKTRERTCVVVSSRRKISAPPFVLSKSLTRGGLIAGNLKLEHKKGCSPGPVRPGVGRAVGSVIWLLQSLSRVAGHGTRLRSRQPEGYFKRRQSDF